MTEIEAITQAINNTGVAEVRNVKDGQLQLHITHRVDPKQLKVWIGIVEYVLARKSDWDAHICKHYFLRDGKVKYIWNFIAQWKDKTVRSRIRREIAKLINHGNRQTPRVVRQLDSYPLVGAKANRNVPKGPMNPKAAGPMTGGVSQKGAHRIG